MSQVAISLLYVIICSAACEQRKGTLLPARNAEPVVEWLEAHPGVEIVSRDRAPAYAEAARKGAPQAVQVADRWHLLHNLVESLEVKIDCVLKPSALKQEVIEYLNPRMRLSYYAQKTGA